MKKCVIKSPAINAGLVEREMAKELKKLFFR